MNKPIGTYLDAHPLLEIKMDADELIAFREELALPRNKDIYNLTLAQANTVEEVWGMVAAACGIALDGNYDPLQLMKMLTTAMQNRGKIVQIIDPNLKEVRAFKTGQDQIMLIDAGESFGTISPTQAGEGPYTICDSCIDSFECCMERSCKLGKSAVQLGNTVAILKKVIM